MKRLVRTYWLRPRRSLASLPPAGPRVRAVLEAFLERFPEYAGCLTYSQSPRRPRYLFVYVVHCAGLFPEAALYLEHLLSAAFPGSRVLAYGRPFREPSEG